MYPNARSRMPLTAPIIARVGSEIHGPLSFAVDVEKMWTRSGFSVKTPTERFFFAGISEATRFDAECGYTFVGRFA